MIVAEFWAEAALKIRQGKQQLTVRRFGWSDQSQELAQSLAEERVRTAADAMVAGQKLPRRERKTAYNGADGMPIREEIVARDGDTVITRNGYGARCLNTPDVLFGDIDIDSGDKNIRSVLLAAALLGVAGLAAWFSYSWGVLAAGMIAAFVILRLGTGQTSQNKEARDRLVSHAARKHLDDFVAANPDWHLRLYETPAGMRVLAMHRLFDPDEDGVNRFFAAIKCDPIYARMCRNQKCFRARVSPKPWRIGISRHVRPCPGIWPIKRERMPLRLQWVAEYEAKAKRFAACRFITSIGSSVTDPKALSVQHLHDDLCQAGSSLPLA